jgi:hypothetical protein
LLELDQRFLEPLDDVHLLAVGVLAFL